MTADGSEISFGAAINLALDEAMGEDPTVFILGEDVADPQGGGVFKATRGLSTKYGERRVRTTPISEQAIVGAAIGAAIAGLRPVAEVMLMNFMAVAMDQVVNHAAKLRYMSGGQTGVPMTIRTAAGVVGSNGAQHSDMSEAWFAHAAGLKIVVPSTAADVKGLLLSAIFDDDPCVVVEHLGLYFGTKGTVGPPGERIPIGLADVVRPGTDVTIIGYGKPMWDVRRVAERLAPEGIECEVIDLRTISPLDDRTFLESVAKTRRAVVVHEAVGPFGVGAEVATRINDELFDTLCAPVARVASAFTPVPFAPTLEAAFLVGEQDIEDAVRGVVDRSRRLP